MVHRLKIINNFNQLNFFTVIIDPAYLIAPESRNKAFYKIWIEETDGIYEVIKESGAKGRVMDRRRWPVADEAAALMIFKRKIRYKTNPDRKSPRKYKKVK